MNREREKKRLLITGASKGFGEGLASELSLQYEIVSLSRVGIQLGGELWKNFEANWVGRESEIMSLILNEIGSIDVLINNAVLYVIKPALQMSREEVVSQFDVNVTAPLMLVGELVKQDWYRDPLLNKERNRCVLNISSLAGVKNFYHQGHSTYAATKSALNVLTKHLAVELEPLNIRVNAVAPTSIGSRVSAERVIREVRNLIEGSKTGCISVLDEKRFYTF